MSSLSELSAAAAIETDDDEPERKRRPIEASAIFCAAVLVVFVLVALLSPSFVGDYRSLDTGSRRVPPTGSAPIISAATSSPAPRWDRRTRSSSAHRWPPPRPFSACCSVFCPDISASSTLSSCE
jgi:hypothetical protein